MSSTKASPTASLNGIAVSRETADRLVRFAALFQKWAGTINLVAPSTLDDLWHRHIADSAQIFHLAPTPRIWIDLGSGGGFPGIVTAIMLAEIGDGWVHLIESNNKKAAFLRAALTETGARGSVHPLRIEAAQGAIPVCDAISARALAELDRLLEFAYPWAKGRPDFRAYFHKGRDYRNEVEKSLRRWSFDLVVHDSTVEKDSVVLQIGDIRPL